MTAGPEVASATTAGTLCPDGSRAAIFGCAGPAMSEDERHFFAAARPYGFILFARNVEDRRQLAALVRDLRETVGWAAPVLVDQEGGRVQRMARPHWRKHPPGKAFGDLHRLDPGAAEALCRLNAHLLGADLAAVGIDVDCLPLLDLPTPGSDRVIGDRAFSPDVDATVALARAQRRGLADAGVTGVIKHMPGHGRAGVDSHHRLPRIDASLDLLQKTDFRPFQAFADMPYGMTGHLLLTAVDPDRPSTTSPVVIERVIRHAIGFDGALMTDDLSMNALGGTIGERAAAAIAAGCDLILHCNGRMEEMRAVLAASPELTGAALDRVRRADRVRAENRAQATPLPDDALERLGAGLGDAWPSDRDKPGR